MNDALHTLLREAARLTRGGQLVEATAALQSALTGKPRSSFGGGSPLQPDAAAHDVIDVEAKLVHAEPTAAAAHAHPAVQEQFVEGLFNGGAQPLRYKLYTPPGPLEGLRPLVLMLHGCTQDPDDFARGTGMNALAARDGVFVLYPAQSQRANSSQCWNWFKHTHQDRERGEPALLAALTRDVMRRHPIDPRRVHVAGLSAGGAMAAILGNTHPDLFASIGVHSGLARGAARDLPSALAAMQGQGMPPGQGQSAHRNTMQAAGRATQASSEAGSRPSAPAIVFHGDRDGTVHPGNADQVIAQCLHPDAAALRPAQTDSLQINGRDCTRSLYRSKDGVVRAEQWVLHGGSHAWSGGHAGGSYTAPDGPDASAEMLRFFREHPNVAATAPFTS